jgi:hypothetical protein
MTDEVLTKAIRVLKTPVTLLALLALVVFGGFWGLQAASAPMVKSSDQCVMTDVGKKLTSEFVALRVLNAGGPSGQAKRTATYMRAYGFNVVRVNTSSRELTNTVIVGNAVDSPEVKLAMQMFPDAVAEADGRTDHVVDILIGAATTTTPTRPTSVPVSGAICLPQRDSVAASAATADANK